jgi:hypothetical protein
MASSQKAKPIAHPNINRRAVEYRVQEAIQRGAATPKCEGYYQRHAAKIPTHPEK